MLSVNLIITIKHRIFGSDPKANRAMANIFHLSDNHNSMNLSRTIPHNFSIKFIFKLRLRGLLFCVKNGYCETNLNVYNLAITGPLLPKPITSQTRLRLLRHSRPVAVSAYSRARSTAGSTALPPLLPGPGPGSTALPASPFARGKSSASPPHRHSSPRPTPAWVCRNLTSRANEPEQHKKISLPPITRPA